MWIDMWSCFTDHWYEVSNQSHRYMYGIHDIGLWPFWHVIGFMCMSLTCHKYGINSIYWDNLLSWIICVCLCNYQTYTVTGYNKGKLSACINYVKSCKIIEIIFVPFTLSESNNIPGPLDAMIIVMRTFVIMG